MDATLSAVLLDAAEEIAVLAEAPHNKDHLWPAESSIHHRLDLAVDELESPLDAWLKELLHLGSGDGQASIFNVQVFVVSYSYCGGQSHRHLVIVAGEVQFVCLKHANHLAAMALLLRRDALEPVAKSFFQPREKLFLDVRGTAFVAASDGSFFNPEDGIELCDLVRDEIYSPTPGITQYEDVANLTGESMKAN